MVPDSDKSISLEASIYFINLVASKYFPLLQVPVFHVHKYLIIKKHENIFSTVAQLLLLCHIS